MGRKTSWLGIALAAAIAAPTVLGASAQTSTGLSAQIVGNVQSAGYPVVEVTVSLVDERTGRPVTELSPEPATVEDPSGTLAVVEVAPTTSERIPAAYVLLIDTGGAMQPHIEQTKEMVGRFVESLGPSDVVRVVKFNDGVDVLGTNWVRKDDVNAAAQVSTLQATSELSLVVPAYVRAAEVANSAPSGYDRRAVVSFLSIDGARGEPGLSIDTIASQIPTATFTFAFGSTPVDREQLPAFLQDVADYNDGAFWPIGASAVPADPFAAIQDVMRRVWTVRFRADSLPDGAPHEFKLRLRDSLERMGEVANTYVSGKLGAVTPVEIEGLLAGDAIGSDRTVVVRSGGTKAWQTVDLQLFVDCLPQRCDKPVATGSDRVEWKLRAADFSPGRHSLTVAMRASGDFGQFSDARTIQFARTGSSWDLAPAALVLGIALVGVVATVGLARRRRTNSV